MALGFCAGRTAARTMKRRKTLMRIGVAATLAFVVVRGANLYGDPRPWAGQSTIVMTIISFLNCTKYPPSLSFLLMTLGPALIFLSLADRARPREWNPLMVFGRAPLMFFVVHLPLIRGLGIALTAARYGIAPFLFTPPPTLGTARTCFPPTTWILGRLRRVVVLALMFRVPEVRGAE